jgi:hypothetical protein
MDHSLPNIQHAAVKVGKDCGQFRDKRRPVPAGKVNQDGLIHRYEKYLIEPGRRTGAGGLLN